MIFRHKFTETLTVCLSLVLLSSSTTAFASDFRPISLGHVVDTSSADFGGFALWMPVDVDDDGIWELALTLDDESVDVGVFSPRSGVWIDGPHALPVNGRQWGVGDYDDDGSLEYAYRAQDSILLYDPVTQATGFLWTAPIEDWHYESQFISESGWLEYALFWGHTESGSSLVALNYHTHIYYPPIGGFAHGYVDEWTTYVYDLLTGELKTVFPSGPERYHFISNYPDANSVTLAYDQKRQSRYFRMTEDTLDDDDILRVVTPAWEVCYSGTFPQGGTYHDFYFEYLASATLTQSGQTYLASTFTRSRRSSRYSQEPPVLTAHQDESTDTVWTDTYVEDQGYAGLAAFDLDGAGVDRWILPLASGSGWEIRDIETGSIIDTLIGLPTADLQTGPLFHAGTNDLFYLDNASLYVWDKPTSVDDREPHLVSVPREYSLLACPNPFNSSVRLTWPADVQAKRLAIFNILGQLTRAFDLGTGTARGSLEWNGCDQNGRAMPSGVYFARLQAKNSTALTKLVLLK
jgi:hypothetical protein